MVMYRSRRTGKIYRLMKGDNPRIVVKENEDSDWEIRRWGMGPYGSVEAAEGVIRDRAQRWNWEELKDDEV